MWGPKFSVESWWVLSKGYIWGGGLNVRGPGFVYLGCVMTSYQWGISLILLYSCLIFVGEGILIFKPEGNSKSPFPRAEAPAPWYSAAQTNCLKWVYYMDPRAQLKCKYWLLVMVTVSTLYFCVERVTQSHLNTQIFKKRMLRQWCWF